MHSAIRRDFKQLQWSFAGWAGGCRGSGAANNASQPLGGAAELPGANAGGAVSGLNGGAIEPARSAQEEGNPAFSRPPPSAGPLGCGPPRLENCWPSAAAALWIASARCWLEPIFRCRVIRSCGLVGDLCSYGQHRRLARPLPGMAGRRCKMGRGWPATSCGQIQGRGQSALPLAGSWAPMAVIGPLFRGGDLRGPARHWLCSVGCSGELAHLALKFFFFFFPCHRKPHSPVTRWLWQIATRQRSALLIQRRPEQAHGVDVGLDRAPAALRSSEIPGFSRLAAPAPALAA